MPSRRDKKWAEKSVKLIREYIEEREEEIIDIVLFSEKSEVIYIWVDGRGFV